MTRIDYDGWYTGNVNPPHNGSPVQNRRHYAPESAHVQRSRDGDTYESSAPTSDKPADGTIGAIIAACGIVAIGLMVYAWATFFGA